MSSPADDMVSVYEDAREEDSNASDDGQRESSRDQDANLSGAPSAALSPDAASSIHVQHLPPQPRLSDTQRARGRRISNLIRSRSTDPSATATTSHTPPRKSSVPEIPSIPAKYLQAGQPALLQRRQGDARQKEAPPLPSLQIHRPSTALDGGSTRSASLPPDLFPTRSPRLPSSGILDHAVKRIRDRSQPRASLQLDAPRRKSLSATASQVHEDTLSQLERKSSVDMDSGGRARREDVFLEVANDEASESSQVRSRSRSERISSRLSFANKRRSMPAESIVSPPSSSDRNRPKSSGSAFANRPTSRLEPLPSDLNRHVERYRGTSSRASFTDDGASISGRSRVGRINRYTTAPEFSPMSPPRLAERVRSPDLPSFGRRRPSFGAALPQTTKNRHSQVASQQQDANSDSPGNTSDPKQSLPDSASIDSQTPDTVWDELDDLKSRIKKLELTGKLPQTSGAAVTNELLERPRTATTAPTTIGSSPKHEKEDKKPDTQQAEPSPADAPLKPTVGGPTAANIHPLLHAALAKSKPLLNAPLYRTLEATAADALQLAAMTGSAGPQGTAFSAASIINGVTVGDRHVRRKADAMCRNLTDLCLALCEGKHEAPGLVASSPASATAAPPDGAATLSPRHHRSSLGGEAGGATSRTGGSRPMSRLEARRSSILGSGSVFNSPTTAGAAEDLSASEHETSSPHTNKVPEISNRRFSSRPTSRLQVAPRSRYDEASVSRDEDPTVRPASRALSSTSRSRTYGDMSQQQQHTPPSFRDTLAAARRANSGAHDTNREVSGGSSGGAGRRRFFDPSTPPVLEEEVLGHEQESGEDAGSEFHHQQGGGSAGLRSKSRVMSFGHYYNGVRRAATELVPGRATSLSRRRQQVVVE